MINTTAVRATVSHTSAKMENYNVNEAFFENLSLGLCSSLEKLPGVRDVRLVTIQNYKRTENN